MSNSLQNTGYRSEAKNVHLQYMTKNIFLLESEGSGRWKKKLGILRNDEF